MEYRKLGDLEVSVIGYGAWGIGGAPFWKTEGDQKSLESIFHDFVAFVYVDRKTSNVWHEDPGAAGYVGADIPRIAGCSQVSLRHFITVL